MLISALATQGGMLGPFQAVELRVSQQISTFYEPSVQAMDTQLNAPSTLPVRARTVSGCVNSAFLGLERNRSAVGKTKAPLVAGGPQQLTPPTPQRRLSPGLESWRAGRWVANGVNVLEGRNSCHGRGSTGKPSRSLVKALCQWLGLWKVGRTAEAEPGLPGEVDLR